LTFAEVIGFDYAREASSQIIDFEGVISAAVPRHLALVLLFIPPGRQLQ
jgi:hypothetical protein